MSHVFTLSAPSVRRWDGSVTVTAAPLCMCPASNATLITIRAAGLQRQRSVPTRRGDTGPSSRTGTLTIAATLHRDAGGAPCVHDSATSPNFTTVCATARGVPPQLFACTRRVTRLDHITAVTPAAARLVAYSSGHTGTSHGRER